MSNLVVAANTYMNAHISDMKEPLIMTVTRYVHFVLRSMGIYESEDLPSDSAAGAGMNREETIAPVMNILS